MHYLVCDVHKSDRKIFRLFWSMSSVMTSAITVQHLLSYFSCFSVVMQVIVFCFF